MEPWQSLYGLPSCPPCPRPRPLPSGGDGRAEQTSKRNRKRENQGEGCRRHLRQFLASLLFRLMPPPSTPSPAAHHLATVAPANRAREGRPPCPPLCDAIDTTSPPPRHRSTSSKRPQSSSSGCLSSCPHRSLPRSSLCLLPSPSTPSPVLPFRLRLRFLLFFALISSACSRLFALPSSCSSFLALLPAY